jgi:hypothetical protein
MVVASIVVSLVFSTHLGVVKNSLATTRQAHETIEMLTIRSQLQGACRRMHVVVAVSRSRVEYRDIADSAHTLSWMNAGLTLDGQRLSIPAKLVSFELETNSSRYPGVGVVQWEVTTAKGNWVGGSRIVGLP